MSGSGLLGRLPDELRAEFGARGWAPYRADQALRWLHRGAATYEEMTDLPLAERLVFQQEYPLHPLQLLTRQDSPDGAVKFLWQLADGETVESVCLPGTRARGSLCVSTQAGCALGCAFCATGHTGLRRNLTADEIVGQAVRARALGYPFANLVLMGMGEPLLNYEAVVRAVKLINWEGGLNLGRRRITLSTAGVVPGIRRLMAEEFRIALAVSLNAADDATRSRLMPINRQYPLAELIAACREYSDATGWWMTFEYVVCAGINDRFEDMDRLAVLLDGILRKVNLIPVNPAPGSALQAPSPDHVARLAERLRGRGVSTTIRRSVGSGIAAACGQLRGLALDHGGKR